MDVTRREALKVFTKGTAIAAGALVTIGAPTLAQAEAPAVAERPVGMLYDATKCIGCKACVSACSEANSLPPDTRNSGGLHQAPLDLNDLTRNIIKLHRSDDGKQVSYMKMQCMHCIDPACVAGCPFNALAKDAKTGVVGWDSSKCIGCRYCTVSCPFHVPRFQWNGFNPRVNKCELCRHRLAEGKQPGCTEVCPTGAVIYGTREQLLAEAKRRVAARPGFYFQDRVYGETEGGGTQVFYLSHVPFTDLGLPELSAESVPAKFLKWQRIAYQYMALPLMMYVGLSGSIRKSFKKHQHEAEEQERKTGLRAQL